MSNSIQLTNLTCPDGTDLSPNISGIDPVCAYRGPALYPFQDCCVSDELVPIISLYENCTYFCITDLTASRFMDCVSSHGPVIDVACFPGIQGAAARIRTWRTLGLAILAFTMVLLD